MKRLAWASNTSPQRMGIRCYQVTDKAKRQGKMVQQKCFILSCTCGVQYDMNHIPKLRLRAVPGIRSHPRSRAGRYFDGGPVSNKTQRRLAPSLPAAVKDSLITRLTAVDIWQVCVYNTINPCSFSQDLTFYLCVCKLPTNRPFRGWGTASASRRAACDSAEDVTLSLRPYVIR